MTQLRQEAAFASLKQKGVNGIMTYSVGAVVEKAMMGETFEFTLAEYYSTVVLVQNEDGRYQRVRKVTLTWRAHPGLEIIEKLTEPLGVPFSV